MRAPAAVLLGWAGWLGLWATVLWIWTGDDLAPSLLTAAAVATGLTGLFVQLRRDRGDAARRITDTSISVLLLAVGLTVGMWGLTAGTWLILVGAEIAVFGLGGLVRELLATRREVARR